MKRFLSSFIVSAILICAFCISTTAAGSLLFKDDFEMGAKPINWFVQEYKWYEPDKCLIGYQPARVLQPNFTSRDPKMWNQFYGKYDVQIRDFDDMEWDGTPHTIKMWYRDLFENDPDKGGDQQGAVYYFGIEVETGRVFIQKEHSFKYRDENNILQDGSVNVIITEGYLPDADKDIGGENFLQVGEDAPWYEIGMRVTSGKIEGLIDGQVVISAEADPSDEKLGHIALNSVDSTVGSQRSPLIFWNGSRNSAMYVALDNFEIWTPEYDFTTTVYGDVNGDTKINLADASLLLKKIAKWDVELDETAADVNVDTKINLADASLLLKKIAKWDVELGPTAK
ncbi:MAG: dockerin type I repeat-containing protein [Clostridia bacterium]|nr:dockerin type I repeat-containing protein [Clostridia bacterium]